MLSTAGCRKRPLQVHIATEITGYDGVKLFPVVHGARDEDADAEAILFRILDDLTSPVLCLGFLPEE